jgi:hypothetical protein
LWVLLVLLLAAGDVVLLSTVDGAVVLLSTVAAAVVLLSTAAAAVVLLLERRRLGEHRLGLWGCSFSSPFWKSEWNISNFR